MALLAPASSLAFRKRDVAVVAVGLRVDLRVGGHLDLEVVAGALADKGDQLVGVDQL